MKSALVKFQRLVLLAVVLATIVIASSTSATEPFVLEEATIDSIHKAMQTGTLTTSALVEQYVKRIEAYDQQGPALMADHQLEAIVFPHQKRS